MKKIFIFSFLMCSFYAASNSNKQYSVQVKSNEIQSVTGQFQIETEIYQRLNKVNLDSIWINDDYFTLTCNPNNEYIKPQNDTLAYNICNATLHYDLNNLPYHAKDVEVFYKVILNDSIVNIEKRKIKIYFTPYNTVEVWNQSDLGLIPRSWARPDTIRNSNPTRVLSNLIVLMCKSHINIPLNNSLSLLINE